ncbi:molybdopterin-dependent oxidoreductase [Schlegelella sp. S2-27]|uniref:Molybdopterin-dependent oxidoreductase n=1 Tax=Caldimonas mangrovi TaxID=2944811 RepID=A0ABT0YKV0_9BURK|nr:molybdopterin cofactor-binding domain-containing protein [Caldimonas mangrovi]MCM5678842.1 molybdopterin-dependent oxidoreductase [Caldimonas mangrovi]
MNGNTGSPVSRRDFLRAGAALGGGLMVGYGIPASAWAGQAAHYQQGLAADEFAPTAYVRIARDGTVTVRCGKAEMGQGVLTGFAQIVADELDADWQRVRVEQAPVHLDYANPNAQMMNTGGSTSIRANWMRLRLSGATARAMLVEAAARAWQVDVSLVQARAGELTAPGGHRAGYGEMAEAAAALQPPPEPKLKTRDRYTLIGRPVPRVDTAAKVDGTARFGLDVTLPGLKTAVIAFPPNLGGRLVRFDAQAALAVPGVRQVLPVTAGVAVVADHTWAALEGRRRLEVEWADGPLADLTAQALQASYAEALDRPGLLDHEHGVPPEGSGVRIIAREFEQPFLAHACMEPLNCTVQLDAGHAQVWVGTQNPSTVQRTVAQIAGLPPGRVEVHTTFLGGGFGRRGTLDFVAPAAEIAKAAGVPVKLVYTREDDMKAAHYRPYNRIRVRAVLDRDQKLVSFTARTAVPAISKWTGFGFLRKANGVDNYATECLQPAYAIPHVRVEWVEHDTGVPIWFWRTPGGSQNCLPVETVIDEAAQLAGQDPYAFRRAMLADRPRHRRVLELAAEQAGWGQALPPGTALGIAMVEIFGSIVAEVARVRLAEGRPVVERVTCAVDCGTAINPQQVVAQMESSILYGLSALLYGEVVIDRGVPQSSNFHDYPVLRMTEAPRIDVHIVPGDGPPGGIGEPALPPLLPAVTNALFQLTGERVTRLPLSASRVRSPGA